MAATLVRVYDNLHYKKYDRDVNNFYRNGILSEDKSVILIDGGHLYMTGVEANAPPRFNLKDGRVVIEVNAIEIPEELSAIFELFKKANLALQYVEKITTTRYPTLDCCPIIGK